MDYTSLHGYPAMESGSEFCSPAEYNLDASQAKYVSSTFNQPVCVSVDRSAEVLIFSNASQ